MIRRFAFVIAVLWIGVLANSVQADNYSHLSEYTNSIDGEQWRIFPWDTLSGPVRSNDTLHFFAGEYHNLFISSGPQPSGFNDLYFEIPPIFNADSFPWPDTASHIRGWANQQGNFYTVGENVRARIRIMDHELRASFGLAGTPIDTTQFMLFELQDSAVVFFDCPVDLSGTVSGVLIFGASGDIGLETDIRYACIGDDNYFGYPIPSDCPDKLAIVSEGTIRVLNTVANGRNNSNGLGNSQTNPNFSSIVITGFLSALGIDFTFEDQNDVGDSYQGPSPDDRGGIHMNGGFMQRYRGYVHRSNHGSTGYLRDYHYDERLRDWDFGVYNNYVPVVTPPELSFGEIEVGDTAFMTVELSKLYWGVTIDSLDIAQPFFVSLIEDGAFSQIATVGFAPQIEGTVSDSVHFHLEYFTTSVPLSGIGSPDLSSEEPKVIPASLEISAYPNPFNPETRISIELSEQSSVQLDIYDLQGRLVTNLLNESLSIGRYETRFNGINLSGGVYFARLEAGNITKTTKLLLLK